MLFFNPPNPNQQRKLALGALATSSIIWGINSPVMKLALLVTPIFLLAFLRFFTASFVMLLFKPSLKIQQKDIPAIIVASFFGVTLNIISFFYGLKLSSAINAGIIIAAIPIFTLIGSSIFLKEHIKSNLMIASLFGIVGVGIIVFEPSSGQLSADAFGNLLLLISALSWVGYELISKKLFKIYSPATVTYYSFLIGGLTFLPFAYGEFSVLPEIVSDPKFLLGITYGVFLTSALSYFLWQWGLAQLDASRVGFFFYLDPIVGTIASILILGETVTFYFLAGSLLIFAGLYIAERKLPYHHLRTVRNKSPEV